VFGKLFSKLFGRDEYVLAPAPRSESESRIARLLPNGPSQDQRSLLVAPVDSGDASEAFPTVAHWGFVASFDVRRLGSSIIEQLDHAWLTSSLVRLFGVEKNAAEPLDLERSHERVLLVTPLVNLPEQRFLYGEHLARFNHDVRARLESFADRLESTTPVEEADQRTRSIIRLVDGRNATVCGRVVAGAGKHYGGRNVFDVLYGLGFRWGDGDLFYWPANTESLTVDTSTPPGFFLPEEAAQNRLRVDDLRFTFYLPHTPGAPEVLEAMITTMKHVKARLGGALRGADDEPFDEAGDRAGIARLSRELAEAGFAPGSLAARATF
jgi:hypothetical protein